MCIRDSYYLLPTTYYLLPTTYYYEGTYKENYEETCKKAHGTLNLISYNAANKECAKTCEETCEESYEGTSEGSTGTRDTVRYKADMGLEKPSKTWGMRHHRSDQHMQKRTQMGELAMLMNKLADEFEQQGNCKRAKQYKASAEALWKNCNA